MAEFTLEHCIAGVCCLADMAKDYDKQTLADGISQSIAMTINKQRELRNLPALELENVRALYDQANGSLELLGHLVYETAIGHR
jgi:hypothetical protein